MFIEFAAKQPISDKRTKVTTEGSFLDTMSYFTRVFVACLLAMGALVLVANDAAAQTATDSSITVTWTAPGDDGDVGTATQYDLRYSLSPINVANFNSATAVTGLPAPQPAGASELFTVSGLIPNTTYFFAIKAADEKNNWSGISNIVSRSTLQEAYVPSVIVDLSAGAATENTVTLNWTAPGDDGSVGTASQYDIRYSSSPITAANFNSATQVSGEPTPQPAGSAESFIVSGLTEGTTYYFAIKAADEVPNWSGMSNVASSNTASDAIPPGDIDDLATLTGPVYGSIAIAFTAPGADSTYGRAYSYELRISTDSITTSTWNTATLISNPPDPLPAGSPETLIVTGLTPGQMYYAGVRAWDQAVNSSAISNVGSGEANVNIWTGIDDEYVTVPGEYELSQNYPNPFNPSTVIAYSLPHAASVNLTVFNVNGQHVRTLVDQRQSAGSHEIVWNGDNDYGRQVATGVYFYRLLTEDFAETRKMVFVK